MANGLWSSLDHTPCGIDYKRSQPKPWGSDFTKVTKNSQEIRDRLVGCGATGGPWGGHPEGSLNGDRKGRCLHLLSGSGGKTLEARNLSSPFPAATGRRQAMWKRKLAGLCLDEGSSGLPSRGDLVFPFWGERGAELLHRFPNHLGQAYFLRPAQRLPASLPDRLPCEQPLNVIH